MIIRLRNIYYEKKLITIKRLPCKVISVGNITMGGTGKTPTVIYLSNLLKKKGYKIAIVSRGYKRTTNGAVLVSDGIKVFKQWEEVGDEPYMMAKKLKGVPIVVDKNRYRGGMLLVKEFNPDIILMDDGFQHRKLHRDFDIILVNGKDDYSKHALLPYGFFREPWSSILRADVIMATKQKPSLYLREKIKKTSLPFFDTNNKYSCNLIKPTQSNKLLRLKKKRVFLCCGIADPISFKKAIIKMQSIICGLKFFPDHFNYTKNDIWEIETQAKMNDADFIVTTEKDWVKIKKYDPEFDLAVISFSIEVKEEEKFIQLLQSFSI